MTVLCFFDCHNLIYGKSKAILEGKQQLAYHWCFFQILVFPNSLFFRKWIKPLYILNDSILCFQSWQCKTSDKHKGGLIIMIFGKKWKPQNMEIREGRLQYLGCYWMFTFKSNKKTIHPFFHVQIHIESRQVHVHWK